MGRRHLLTTLIVGLLLGASSATTALAQARPHLSWSLPNATAGTPTSVSWSASRVPAGAQLVIQRPVGTAKVWRDVARLSGSSGTASLPAESLGSYPFRLAALGSHHRVLAQSQRSLHVFGKVPFAVLFGQTTDTFATPSASFAYAFNKDGAQNGIISVTKNPCESVTVEFALGSAYADTSEFSGEQGTVSIVQQTRDPVSASAGIEGLNSISTTLVPGQSWSVNDSESSSEGHSSEFEFFLNGSAVCDSAAQLGS